MLTIVVRIEQGFDQEKQEFVSLRETTLQLEHSLVSLSKWESEFEKPFLDGKDKTNEETLAYIKTMCLTPEVPPDIWNYLSDENITEINNYIKRKMTATTINDRDKPSPNREIITAELVYYWMVALTIPWEAQYWHLNKLLTLIRVCNIKNQPPKKMSRRDAAQAAQDRVALNAQRQAAMRTRG